MSIGNIMRTSTAGMNVQASKLGAVSENVANSDTTGYKRSEMEFSSMVMPQTNGTYSSGSVSAVTRNTISQSGPLNYTGNGTDTKKLDLAMDGDGFFVVGDGNGGKFLTRAGSFTMQSDGTLVNAAGYTLEGYPVGTTGTQATLNNFAGLESVNLNTGLLSATPSTSGILTYPLDKSFITGTKAVVNQASAFSMGTKVSGAADDPADYIELKVAIDGAAPVTVQVKGATGLGSISAADVAKAINDTSGLNGVATVVDGRLSFTSNSKASGTASKIALSVTGTANADGTVSVTGQTNTTPTGPVYKVTGLSGFLATAPGATGAAAPDPAANLSVMPSAKSTTATSMTVYNNAGEAVKLDVYYTKTDDATNTWKMAVFDGRGAGIGSTAPFPYASGPLATATLTFDANNGYKLATITPGTGTGQTNNDTLNINLGSVGAGNFNLFLGNTTQLYKPDAQALSASANGNPPEVIKQIQVGDDGIITAQFTSGTTRQLFKIPVTKVASPDSLTAVAGNAYQVGVESGSILMGTGGMNGFGKVTAGALESSNVDLASELTDMITAQRSYTANSKVFQTGSEILDVLVNLKR